MARGEPAAYMGLSTNLKGAVFATKAVRANKGKSRQASEVNQFNLKGLDYKIEPKNLWAGQCFLPHYRTTCPAHLTASKRLASGEPLETILPDPEERERYLDEYEQFLAQLKQGKAPTPPALADISAVDDTTGLYGPNDTVPKTTQRSCNASLLNRDENTLSGYQFRVPYLVQSQSC